MSTRDEVAERRADRLSEAERDLYETFRGLGHPPALALRMTQGRDGDLSSTDPAEQLAETLARLTPQGGRTDAEQRRLGERAAMGRDHHSLSSLSRELRESATAAPVVPTQTARSLPVVSPSRAAELRRDPRNGYGRRALAFVDEGMSPAEANERAEQEIVAEAIADGRITCDELVESAIATGGVLLREAGAGAVTAAVSGSRRKITIISKGWGSSGYYSRELLERDGPKVFPVGTQMFLDHPGRAEESDRPERSVRDLAARIATRPRMEGNDLVAEADIFPVWQPTIDSIAADIGLSIRAMGETQHGEAEGRTGPLVQALTEGISVDFVTKAGAGGKVGELIESARLAARS